MPDDKDKEARNESLFDVLERIRTEHYPHIDREIVREILRLHADPGSNNMELSRALDEMIFARTGN
ncbi:hypothetical protein ATY76_22300 [Rhizobium sp. R339]|uniref:hypothetical protein n=1 Tax=Rhizobium sp. R339 TaxID=1764273 RepID=UPI000B532EAB|nr:hypothetical protein [Rhizobium sp. R339]OWV64182.1 hypothetical protein ATY76_22300 [Rhizobium sp. R339]